MLVALRSTSPFPVLGAAILVVALIGGWSTAVRPAFALSKTGPELVAGNPACPEGSIDLKIEDPSGTFSGSAGGASVSANLNATRTAVGSFTLTASGGRILTDAIVFVKGGPDANKYVYTAISAPTLTDTNPLTTPGSQHQVSHVSFCVRLADAGTSTPAASPTQTRTATSTQTSVPPTATPTVTQTPTPAPPTVTPTPAASATTASVTQTTSPTQTTAPSATATATNSATVTMGPTATVTAPSPAPVTPVPSSTVTNTPTVPPPTSTGTATATPEPSHTPTATSTRTVTQIPSVAPSSTPLQSASLTPQAIGSGCGHGYWKQPHHFDSWAPAGLDPNQTLESVFDVPDDLGMDNVTLRQALSFSGGPGAPGGARILLRGAIASLLNAAHPNVSYPQSPGQVVAAVNQALSSGNRGATLALVEQLDTANNGGCPLS